MELSCRLVLTNLPIEIDGKLYRVIIADHPDIIKSMVGRKILELEEIEEAKDG